MLTPFRFDDHGHVQFDWLDTHHHFSFGDYYNPQREGFGPLRVINDDLIKAGERLPLPPAQGYGDHHLCAHGHDHSQGQPRE